jgi:predicted deacetylase
MTNFGMMLRERNSYTLLGWWESKLVQPLWKAVWRHLTRLKIELSHDQVIQLLGIYLKECKSGCNRDTCTPLFIAALFTITKSQDIETAQVPYNSCLTADEWIKKMWYIYIMEYYSAIKKNEIMLLQVNEWNWRLS